MLWYVSYLKWTPDVSRGDTVLNGILTGTMRVGA